VFTFTIDIRFPEQIESIKADLTKSLPHIKSSHRVEAMARSLGFKSYAALRAHDLFHHPLRTDVDWVAFRNYLEEKGFSCKAKPLFIAIGRAAVRLILEVPNIEPELTREGIGVSTLGHERETQQEHIRRFRQARLDMLLDASVEEFLRSYYVVSQIQHTRTITNKKGSYKLKHIAEKVSFTYPDGEVSLPNYVCSGMLICAALHAGFWYKPTSNPHNVHFNMLQKSIEQVDQEISPQRIAS
tara:strand:+ start:1542 stop:2267 length:726 start_codon:yes stop_codon:yes gene_type:complete